MRVEEIVVSAIPSDFGEEAPPLARVSTAALRQSDRFRSGRSAFELFDHRLLSVRREQAFHPAQDYELDIRILGPTPRRSLKISAFYLSACLLSAAYAVLIRFTDSIPQDALLPSMLWTGAGALLLLLLAGYRSHDRLVFYSRHGRVPLVILRNRHPDRKTFKAFTDILIRSIEEAEDSSASRTDILSRELKEHRRLLERGVISEQRYERVKRRILDLHR